MLPWRQCLVVATLVLSFVPIARAAGKHKMPEPEPFGRFTVDQVDRRLNQPNVHVFDGNRPETYVENHLPGAVRLYSKDIKEGVLPADKDSTLIFYCMNEL
jgi:hypothetical protein